jgi:hypothetical protein
MSQGEGLRVGAEEADHTQDQHSMHTSARHLLGQATGAALQVPYLDMLLLLVLRLTTCGRFPAWKPYSVHGRSRGPPHRAPAAPQGAGLGPAEHWNQFSYYTASIPENAGRAALTPPMANRL